MNEKTCSVCGETKSLTEFYVAKGGKRPGLVASECKVCKAGYGKRYYEANREHKLDWFSKRYQDMKDKVFNAYGGYKCSCCGETEPLFLTIDHIDSDGAKHRQEITPESKDFRDYRSSTGYKTYSWLIKHNYPPGFQVLCSNCNHGKHRNGGICPHKRPEGSTTRAKARTRKAIVRGSAEPLTTG